VATGQDRPILWLAPALSAALLVAMMAAAGASSVNPDRAEAYRAAVRRAAESIPYKVGRWVGRDVEAPPAAVKILRPNVLLQRRYTDPATGRAFSLLLVHTGDARDMLGHYPPKCYPAHGWVEVDRKDTSIALGAGSVPATEYSFTRTSDGFEQSMNVIGFFVVPGGPSDVVASYGEVTAAGRRRDRAGLGAAQIQLVSGGDLDAAERREIAAEFVQAIEPVIRIIAGGAERG